MINCNVKEYGAVGDSKTLDTQWIQKAIDECHKNGGGKVIFEGGRFLSGRINLKSGVELHIERDAVLLGSANVADFPEIQSDYWRGEFAPRFNRRCFIYAENCTDIAITGRGAIDCQGAAYVSPMTEEEMAARPLLSYVRKPFPLPEGSKPLDESVTMVGNYPHPLDPRSTSLAPARVVFFIGCTNVLVQDVTMRNQPAGWSYWICDCEHVHFHRAKILAAVDMPNNDGIHINCSRNVTVSDCNISCGDDCVVVRAYSAPLYENKVCEKICVTNCNLTSHTFAIRVGWINDGTIRNCSFSNLNISESNVGIGMCLPGNPANARMSDEGFESTHIENITFSNITMSNLYSFPVLIKIDEHNLCDAITNIYFSGIHAFSAKMPMIKGRADCHVSNIFLTDCHFNQITYQDIPTKFASRMAKLNYALTPPTFNFVDNLALNNTFFNIL